MYAKDHSIRSASHSFLYRINPAIYYPSDPLKAMFSPLRQADTTAVNALMDERLRWLAAL